MQYPSCYQHCIAKTYCSIMMGVVSLRKHDTRSVGPNAWLRSTTENNLAPDKHENASSILGCMLYYFLVQLSVIHRQPEKPSLYLARTIRLACGLLDLYDVWIHITILWMFVIPDFSQYLSCSVCLHIIFFTNVCHVKLFANDYILELFFRTTRLWNASRTQSIAMAPMCTWTSGQGTSQVITSMSSFLICSLYFKIS